MPNSEFICVIAAVMSPQRRSWQHIRSVCRPRVRQMLLRKLLFAELWGQLRDSSDAALYHELKGLQDSGSLELPAAAYKRVGGKVAIYARGFQVVRLYTSKSSVVSNTVVGVLQGSFRDLAAIKGQSYLLLSSVSEECEGT